MNEGNMSWMKDDGTCRTRRRATFRIFKEARRGKALFHLQILNADGKPIRRMECTLDLPTGLDEEIRSFIEASLESGAKKAAIGWIQTNCP